jgi:hypothetical protein
MMKVSCLTILLVLAVAVIMASGCIGGGEDTVSGTGTIKYIDLEGGFYGIIGDDDENYEPIELIQQFQRDDLEIYFEAKILEDIHSIHMWGTVIEITKIERLGG